MTEGIVSNKVNLINEQLLPEKLVPEIVEEKLSEKLERKAEPMHIEKQEPILNSSVGISAFTSDVWKERADCFEKHLYSFQYHIEMLSLCWIIMKKKDN